MQQSDNNVNVDINEDFGQDGPNSQTSLEDLCRSHLVNASLWMHFHLVIAVHDANHSFLKDIILEGKKL